MLESKHQMAHNEATSAPFDLGIALGSAQQPSRLSLTKHLLLARLLDDRMPFNREDVIRPHAFTMRLPAVGVSRGKIAENAVGRALQRNMI
jgi:hypothetical protein